MAIFVDKAGHLVSDATETELHDFAISLGLKAHWFQEKKHQHYDLITRQYKPNERLINLAISFGAQLVSSKEIVLACRRLNNKCS